MHTQSMHLVADNLGWLEERRAGGGGFRIDEALRARGERVARLSEADLARAAGSGAAEGDGGGVGLTAADVAGWSKVEALLSATRGGGSGGGGSSGGGGGAENDGDGGVVAVEPADFEAWRRVAGAAQGGGDSRSSSGSSSSGKAEDGNK